MIFYVCFSLIARVQVLGNRAFPSMQFTGPSHVHIFSLIGSRELGEKASPINGGTTFEVHTRRSMAGFPSVK